MDTTLSRIEELARSFAAERAERQDRTALDAADFVALRDAGFPLLAVPRAMGGAFDALARSVRPVCAVLRALARGDSSVALVCAMHPAVLSYWLAEHPVSAAERPAWERQRGELFAHARGGAFFGTITSEPGSGGDIARTRAQARPVAMGYVLDGQKHFGSGMGMTSFMVTTAIPTGEEHADWFLLDVRGVPWDGSAGLTLCAAWDGYGMCATQSHAMTFSGFPAMRIAWPGHRHQISAATGPFIGCLFAAVIVGVVDVALELGRAQLARRQAALSAYEQVEWARAEMEGWLVAQALEGMLRAAEQEPPRAREVQQGKVAIAELAETCLQRACRVMGGGSYSRRSPFGHLLQDVRALGFLRPPWALAYEGLLTS
jgi:alkylation response protein AidB-like acyl-CoA dehydrogenase